MNIPENMVRLLILDISGVYTQLYDEVWVDREELAKEQAKYSDEGKWRCVVTG